MHGKPSYAGRNGSKNGEDPLSSAITRLQRYGCTEGEESHDQRQAAAQQQKKSLINWARGRRLVVPRSSWDLNARIGGAEYDVWTHSGFYYKATRADHFGWTVLAGEEGSPDQAYATPLEYLQRWRLSNQLFGDTAQIHGISSSVDGMHIIIRQPYVHGKFPTQEQIQKMLARYGFIMIPGFSLGAQRRTSYYHPIKRIGIFDAAEDNFILSSRMPVPIDVVPIKAGNLLHEQLIKLL